MSVIVSESFKNSKYPNKITMLLTDKEKTLLKAVAQYRKGVSDICLVEYEDIRGLEKLLENLLCVLNREEKVVFPKISVSVPLSAQLFKIGEVIQTNYSSALDTNSTRWHDVSVKEIRHSTPDEYFMSGVGYRVEPVGPETIASADSCGELCYMNYDLFYDTCWFRKKPLDAYGVMVDDNLLRLCNHQWDTDALMDSVECRRPIDFHPMGTVRICHLCGRMEYYTTDHTWKFMNKNNFKARNS